MKYAYKQNDDGNIVFTSSENLIFWKEITQNVYDAFIEARNADKIVYCDLTGNLAIRDKETIWDETTQTWIVDTVAVEAQAKQILISEANQAYHVNLLDRHQYNKLSVKQQKELDTYLDLLLDIVNGESNATKLPVKPDWLS